MTDPSIDYQMPNARYQHHPALSASRAKKLLPPSTPAHLRYEMRFPRQFDLTASEVRIGSAVHAKLFGGAKVVVLDEYKDWRKADARAQRDGILAGEDVPLLEVENAVAVRMREALVNHPVISQLVAEDRGDPEVSILWTDEETGVDCRARIDWLPRKVPGQRLVVVDLKTTADSAHPGTFTRTAANLDYAFSAGWYLDGIEAIGMDEEPTFLHVVIEQRAPYLISLDWIDPEDIAKARELTAWTRRRYAQCVATDEWPGYPTHITKVSMPTWWRIRADDILEGTIA